MSEKNKSSEEKKQDKELTDILIDDFGKFEHFIVENWKKIILCSVFVIIAVALITLYIYNQRTAEKKAGEAFANSETVQQLRKVFEKYDDDSYKFKFYARYRLASLLLEKGDYSSAQSEFEKLIKMKNLPRYYLWLGNLQIAYLLEEQGKTAEAAAKFADISNNVFSVPPVKAEAAYSAGRLYLDLKKLSKAKEYLQTASKVKTTDNPYSRVPNFSELAFGLLKTIPSAEK